MPDQMFVKLGKKEPKRDIRTLKLASFLPKLPPPLKEIRHDNGRKSWGMMLNNQVGDCTIAGAAHQIQLWTMNTKTIVTVPDQAVLQYYKDWAGYDGTSATDTGAYELDILNQWRKNGLAGHKLLAYADPPRYNFEMVKHAIQLFGGLYIGMSLPWSAAGQDTWKVKTPDGGLWGGHCVVICGYDPDWLYCITWGKIVRMTWDFWLKYTDEAHCLVGEDWLPHYPSLNNETIVGKLLQAVGTITNS